jgi:omega-hydroxypalmitate O-feruloyl transferase
MRASVQVAEAKQNGVAMAGSKAQLISVKRGEPTLVPPAEATPTGEQYYLSNLDQNIAVIVQTVYCFKCPSGRGHDGAADALRAALARVLVHYHPLAGRLGISKEMKLTVECTGEGAPFVEADAGCDLADIGDLSTPDPAALGQLVYSVPGAKNILEMPPITAQVRHATRTPARAESIHCVRASPSMIRCIASFCCAFRCPMRLCRSMVGLP